VYMWHLCISENGILRLTDKGKGKADYTEKHTANGERMRWQGGASAFNPRGTLANTPGGFGAGGGRRWLQEAIGAQTARVVAWLNCDSSRPGFVAIGILNRDQNVPASRDGDVP